MFQRLTFQMLPWTTKKTRTKKENQLPKLITKVKRSVSWELLQLGEAFPHSLRSLCCLWALPATLVRRGKAYKWEAKNTCLFWGRRPLLAHASAAYIPSEQHQVGAGCSPLHANTRQPESSQLHTAWHIPNVLSLLWMCNQVPQTLTYLKSSVTSSVLEIPQVRQVPARGLSVRQWWKAATWVNRKQSKEIDLSNHLLKFYSNSEAL